MESSLKIIIFPKLFDCFIVKLAPKTFWGNDGRKRDALKMCAVK